ncbi:hypothetical protein N7541_011381 [Penicillium brevicompactum]|uniref:Ubiquitin carboxyl-terminal hydrolase 19 n=1 Tax=Penicillium brevicompactum TaxID=5074 RepID=A0A9W9QQ74_PENBR|nr:hypothetical protein N7541_011381 [Penicillium brevicompactum]
MDAQFPFASRDDIWRVLDELKELHRAQLHQGERLAQLERRRDEDARLRSPWASASPFPTSVGAITPGSPHLLSAIGSPLNKPVTMDPAFHSPPDAFKGFDQGHHSAMAHSAVGFDSEEEPRRGASRANSVRFDESALHGYGQAARTSTDLPSRSGSASNSHPLLERTFSQQSDGRFSSSGHSYQSGRSNSLRLNTRLSGQIPVESPLIPPPGLFLLGPVPSIIRCWLNETFTNGSLLYAAICTGSYVSTVSLSLIRSLGMEDMIVREDDVTQYIKLPVYLPEATIHPSSSQPEAHQVPCVFVRFVVRENEPAEHSIQVIIGSDVLRAQNADILFSQDKLLMVDSDHQRVSVPLVRPEDDQVFKSLSTSPSSLKSGSSQPSSANGNGSAGVIGNHSNAQQQSTTSPLKAISDGTCDSLKSTQPTQPAIHNLAQTAAENRPVSSAPTSEITRNDMPVWENWRERTSNPAPKIDPKNEKREMKVFRPAKSTGRFTSGTSFAKSAKSLPSSPHPQTSPEKGVNAVGGSAFPWLNPALDPVTRDT